MLKFICKRAIKAITPYGIMKIFNKGCFREIKNKDDIINELNSIIKNMDNIVNKLNTTIESKDNIIIQLNDTIDKLLGKSTHNLSFKTLQDFTYTIRKNLHKLPNDIDAIIGVPRSGILPATLIALFKNKKFFTVNEFINKINVSHGLTREIDESPIKKILVVDDSITSGTQLKNIKEKLKNFTDYKIEFLCIYSTNESRNFVDYYFEIVPHPRIFQWNYLNHAFASVSCYDLDGVLCVDPTVEQNDDGEKYIEFIKNAKPLYIPKFKIHSIVTSRLEKYRSYTEQWLEKNNVKYDNLYMLNLNTAEERRRLNCHAKFKADIFSKSNCKYFIESEPSQAYRISILSGKPSICVETDELFDNIHDFKIF